MKYLKLGKIISTKGLKGVVRVYSTTDFAEKRFKKGNKVYLEKNNQLFEMIIATYAEEKGFVLVSFKDYQDINLIEPFLQAEIQVSLEEIPPLEDGYFYHYQLIGLKVIDQEGKEFGKVQNVEEFTANRSLRILLPNGKTFLLPFIKPFIKNIDLEKKILEVELVKGMGE